MKTGLIVSYELTQMILSPCDLHTQGVQTDTSNLDFIRKEEFPKSHPWRGGSVNNL